MPDRELLKRARQGDATGEDGAGAAYLLGNIFISFQHSAARMEIRIGVRCGRETPSHRHDVFTESQGRRVTRRS